MSTDRTRQSHPPRLARLALHVPDAGSSGIIDIANLQVEPVPAALASSLLPAATASAPATRRSAWPTIGLRLALASSIAMVGLAGLLRLAPDTATDQTTATGGQLAMHEAALARDPRALAPAPIEARSRAPARVTAEDPREAAEPADAEPTMTAAPVPEAEPESAPPAKPAARKTSKARARSTSTSAALATKPTASTPPATTRSIPVECVLDPARCDAAATGGSGPSASSRPAPLPAKLSTTQLKTALASTKADARRCGPEHGADAGTTVRVQLSIEGATGSVLAATPQGEHANTALGVCVARALGQTQFSRFSAKRMGTLYSVRL